jgi:cytochrome c-type biogenesis protein CcmH
MPPGDRAAMIQSMVDSLARRLEQSPRDADGWIKLIRSRVVLGGRSRRRRRRRLSAMSGT